MKKIILFIGLLIFLASCGQTQQGSSTTSSSQLLSWTTQEMKIKQLSQEKEVLQKQTQKNYFQELKNKISKLEKLGVSQEELQIINDQLNYFIDKQIEKKALENISICEQASNSQKCIETIAIKKSDSLLCERLINPEIKTRCINKIVEQKAKASLDEKLCLKIIDTTQEKILQKSCQDKIIFEKALKNKNINLCYKIFKQTEKEICKQEVKMLKQIEKTQAR